MDSILTAPGAPNDEELAGLVRTVVDGWVMPVESIGDRAWFDRMATARMRRVAWSPVRLFGTLMGGLVIATAIAIVVLLSSSPSQNPSGNNAGTGGSAGVAPAHTDVPLTPPPSLGGSCPVTPFTVLDGGVVPMIDASGVRWSWSGVPWRNGVSQIVLLYGPNGALVEVPATLEAERISVAAGASPVATAFAPVYRPGVYHVTLPESGCWRLTVSGSSISSSVIVSTASTP